MIISQGTLLRAHKNCSCPWNIKRFDLSYSSRPVLQADNVVAREKVESLIENNCGHPIRSLNFAIKNHRVIDGHADLG